MRSCLVTLLAFTFNLAKSSGANIQQRTTPPETSTLPTAILPPPTPTSTCDPTPYAYCTPYTNTTFIPPTAHFNPTSPATLRVNDAQESAIISALSSVEATWTEGPVYPQLKSAVYEVAPTPARQSLAVAGYNWDAIVRADWYTSVPSSWQAYISVQEKALQDTFDNMTRVGATSDGKILRGSVRIWVWVVMIGVLGIVVGW